LPTARGAVRRSLLIWGWGQIATGDRRGWLLVPLEPLAIAGLVLVGVPLASGTAANWVFLGGTLVLALWAGQAIHAYRRAVHRREPFGLSGADGGAIEVLWLAPIGIVAATIFWAVAGSSASAETTVSRYAADWEAGNATDASQLFVGAIDGAEVSDAWDRELPRLRNALVVAAAAAGPGGGIDPALPFDALRWEADPPAPDGRVVVHVRLVRQEIVRDTFFGLVPTTRQRLVPIDDLGTLTLVRVANAGPVGGQPRIQAWRIENATMLGESIGATSSLQRLQAANATGRSLALIEA
jgi:hypothetical protein